MEVIAERTAHVTGLAVARGGSGDPSPWTALGCEVAIARRRCERAFGTRRPRGPHGRGDRPRPRRRPRSPSCCAAAGAELVVADVDRASASWPTGSARAWTDPTTALTAEVDVVAPCALGGVLDDDDRARAALPRDRRRGQQPARRRRARRRCWPTRGILWAPDFVCNAGGIINIAVELEPEGYAPERADDARARRRRHAAHDLRRAPTRHAAPRRWPRR